MENQKHLFQLPHDVHYLNCASKAPLLRASENAAIKALEQQRNPANLKPEDFFNNAETARQLFANLVNCRSGDVAIIPSVSYGLASVLQNIPAHKGGHSIVVEDEFPSGYFAAKRWCEKNACELRVVRPNQDVALIGQDWNDRILQSINEKTAFVLISSVLWTNGVHFDLERISKKCRTVGAKLIVDGTQSVGAVPIDVSRLKLDALVCAGYKWLFGPYSTAIAYISEEFSNGIPLEETWMNRTNARDFSNLNFYDPNYREGAARYNMGETSNFILTPMLIEGLKLITELTVEEIQAYCKNLSTPLLDFLGEVQIPGAKDPYISNHLIGFKLPASKDMEILQAELVADKIYVSIRGGAIRVSVNVFNVEDDIHRFISILGRYC